MTFCKHCGRGSAGGWVEYRLIAREHRTSRRDRQCVMCSKAIRPGDVYARMRHIIENELRNDDMCIECEPLRVAS